MGIGRLIRRTAPLIVLGVAGAAAARRRSERMRQAQLAPPPYPPPVAEAGPVVEAEPEPQPDPEPEPEEQPTVEDTALEQAPWLEPKPEEPEPELEEEAEVADPASVTEIVDDLLAPDAADDAIEDATVVEGFADEDGPDDEALADAVRAALSDQAGELPAGVGIDVQDGSLVLSGQVERAEAIADIERRAESVPGIRSVSSLLHLPGTPPPAASEHR